VGSRVAAGEKGRERLLGGVDGRPGRGEGRGLAEERAVGVKWNRGRRVRGHAVAWKAGRGKGKGVDRGRRRRRRRGAPDGTAGFAASPFTPRL
jgi:hypothetical protein